MRISLRFSSREINILILQLCLHYLLEKENFHYRISISKRGTMLFTVLRDKSNCRTGRGTMWKNFKTSRWGLPGSSFRETRLHTCMWRTDKKHKSCLPAHLHFYNEPRHLRFQHTSSSSHKIFRNTGIQHPFAEHIFLYCRRWQDFLLIQILTDVPYIAFSISRHTHYIKCKWVLLYYIVI